MYLIKNGVPFDVAWTMEDHYVLAYCVTFGKAEGNEFDWASRSWRKQEG